MEINNWSQTKTPTSFGLLNQINRSLIAYNCSPITTSHFIFLFKRPALSISSLKYLKERRKQENDIFVPNYLSNNNYMMIYDDEIWENQWIGLGENKWITCDIFLYGYKDEYEENVTFFEAQQEARQSYNYKEKGEGYQTTQPKRKKLPIRLVIHKKDESLIYVIAKKILPWLLKGENHFITEPPNSPQSSMNNHLEELKTSIRKIDVFNDGKDFNQT